MRRSYIMAGSFLVSIIELDYALLVSDMSCLAWDRRGARRAERSSRRAALWPGHLRGVIFRRPLKAAHVVWRRKGIPGLPPGDRHRSWRLPCGPQPRARSRTRKSHPSGSQRNKAFPANGDKQRTSALALCESLMHSKRPGRIDRCRLESTRNHTGAFFCCLKSAQ